MQPGVVQVIRRVLDTHAVPYEIGKTWTTDALYRETRARIARRQADGCRTVEMECAAFLAVAAFRDVPFGQLLLAGVDISGHEWDPRHTGEKKVSPERLFWLAAEACSRL